MILTAIVLCPLLGALVMGTVGHRKGADALNVLFSFLTFGLSIVLAFLVFTGGAVTGGAEQLYSDGFSAIFVVITGGVGATTSLFSLRYMAIEKARGHLGAERTRLYLTLYQVFILTMLVVLVSNNLGILWVSLEGATLATVLLVAWTRKPASVKAAWKYFILCGVGIALALFGTILLYFASEKTLGPGGTALLWTHLNGVKTTLEPTVIGLAFIFFIVGYGTKVGLVPLHSWLPDAHAEGPTPISAVLSGLLLNVALYAILRIKVLADGSLHNHLTSRLLLGFGLVSVLLASLSMWRRQDIKRLFAYSSIEHMGLATFAFGLGGPVGAFAGLLHMTSHSLIKSAIFFVVGHVVQTSGSQKIPEIRHIGERTPALARALTIGGLAITGLPPFAIFASEFLILSTAVVRAPWALPPLLLALLITFGVVFRRIQEMTSGPSASGGPALPSSSSPPVLTFYPVWIHFGLALVIGLFFPESLGRLYHSALLSIGLTNGQ